MLPWRDVAIRYRKPVPGRCVGHRPALLSVITMMVIFSKVGGFPRKELRPYAIMVFAAMLPCSFTPHRSPYRARASSVMPTSFLGFTSLA